MSVVLRIILLISSLCLFIYVYRKLKKSQLFLMDAFYWIVFSFFILILGFFPSVGENLSRIFGVAEPSNFIFLCMLFLMILRVFLLTIKVSMLEHKVENLVQEIAIRENAEIKKTERGI